MYVLSELHLCGYNMLKIFKMKTKNGRVVFYNIFRLIAVYINIHKEITGVVRAS